MTDIMIIETTKISYIYKSVNTHQLATTYVKYEPVWAGIWFYRVYFRIFEQDILSSILLTCQLGFRLPLLGKPNHLQKKPLLWNYAINGYHDVFKIGMFPQFLFHNWKMKSWKRHFFCSTFYTCFYSLCKEK